MDGVYLLYEHSNIQIKVKQNERHIAIEGTNAQHYVFRTEYEAFLRHLQIKRNS